MSSKLISITACFCLLFSLAACGSSNLIDDGRISSSGGFVLSVLEESFSQGGSAERFFIEVQEAENEVEVSLHVSGANEMARLYAEMSFDLDNFLLTNAGPAIDPGKSQQILTMNYLEDSGTLYYGLVLDPAIYPSGFSGDGGLVQFTFIRR